MPAAGARHPEGDEAAARLVEANDVIAGAENDLAGRQSAVVCGGVRIALQFPHGTEQFRAEALPGFWPELFADVLRPLVQFGTVRQQVFDDAVALADIVW